MTLEKRNARLEVGETGQDEDGRSYMWARVLNYNVVDSHRTSWKKGVFGDSLTRSMPKLCIGHDWDGVRVIGKAVESRETDEGLDIKFRFSSFEDNPEARRFYAHARDGEVDEFSVGFYRQEDEEDPNLRSVKRITKAQLKEVSFVLSGSVPGTKMLSLRSVTNDEDPAELTEDELREKVSADFEVSDLNPTQYIAAASLLLARVAAGDLEVLAKADELLDEFSIRAGLPLVEAHAGNTVVSTAVVESTEERAEEDEVDPDADVLSEGEARVYALAGILDMRSESRGSSASLDRSPKHNFVEDNGGLPKFIREIAREVEKKGHTLSQAIAIAVSQVKKLAAKGNEKAAKALAEWEALKAKAAK